MRQHILTGVTLWAIPRFHRETAPALPHTDPRDTPNDEAHAMALPPPQELYRPEQAAFGKTTP